MSAPPSKPPPAGATNKEEGAQAQPMDLASKPNQNPPPATNITAVPTRFVGEAPAGIFLVRPAGSPPVITLPTPPATAAPSTAASIVQPGPVTVSVPMPITMARFQAAIRPGTTVTLAPRVVPTPLVTTSGGYAGQSSHVPKGAAAVASIAIPRSAVTAAVIRPVPATNPAASQVTGLSIASRAARPSSVAVRPAGLEGAAANSISGTWVTVTPAGTAPAAAQTPPVPTLYKATDPAGSATSVKNPTNLILTGQPNKPAPVLTPAPNSLSIIGQSKQPVPNPASGITLLSVRGSNPSVTARPVSNPPASITVAPRPATEVIKTAPMLLPSAQQQQRTPSMTITSTSSVQGVDKHFVKTLPGTGAANAARNPQAGPIQIAARTTPSAAAPSSTVITTHSAMPPVVFTGALKNMTPIANVAGKVGQPGIAVQFPQMSVSAVAASKVIGSAPHAPVVAGIRPVSGASAVPVAPGGGNLAVGGARTYLVTTQPSATSAIPVAKVLPQPAATGGGNGGSARAETTASAEVPHAAPPVQYQAAASRPAPAASAEVVVTAAASHPPVSQSNTPSKMLGTSPRPSILRKRDYEGVPLKAQKNLSATLTNMNPAATTPTASSAASVPTTPAISPPSPRRLDLGMTPSGTNGDSSRSSSGGSTTLSASSSPGIPPDMDESIPPANIGAPAAALGKALSNIQVKQEAVENAETSGAIASLMRMSSAASGNPPSAPEVQMSPRKKPRKQQLHGQELQEVRSSDDEMPPAVNLKEVKQEPAAKNEPKEVAAVVKRPRVSLISSYRQSWKARNHHFTRYSDVKLKDERRPTVTDLANQKHVLQKVHGWKVFHLTAQIEDMAYSESQIHERLSAVLEVMENLGAGKSGDRDLNRVNELIKGNLQRSKVIQDGLEDSKTQVQKLFDHKPRAEEIIQRYMFKRLAKKREKM